MHCINLFSTSSITLVTNMVLHYKKKLNCLPHLISGSYNHTILASFIGVKMHNDNGLGGIAVHFDKRINIKMKFYSIQEETVLFTRRHQTNMNSTAKY